MAHLNKTTTKYLITHHRCHWILFSRLKRGGNVKVYPVLFSGRVGSRGNCCVAVWNFETTWVDLGGTINRDRTKIPLGVINGWWKYLPKTRYFSLSVRKKTHLATFFFSTVFHIWSNYPLPNVPSPRNKGFHGRPKLKGNQWSISPAHKAGYFFWILDPNLFSTWISERDLGKIFKIWQVLSTGPQPVERSFARHLVGMDGPMICSICSSLSTSQPKTGIQKKHLSLIPNNLGGLKLPGFLMIHPWSTHEILVFSSSFFCAR